MTPGLRRDILGFFFVCLLLYTAGGVGFSQTHTFTANENVYKHVTGGGVAGTDFVIVDNLTDFARFNPGDTVLVIQMKGVESRVDEGALRGLHGDPTQLVGSPGRYEFLIILSTNSGTLKIQFKNNLTNSYDPTGDVQIIRVPSYYNASIGAGGLTCPAWDSTSKTGGVITLIIGKTLTLNGDIDASGKGFRGGAPVTGDGTCTELGTDNYAYDLSYSNSGLKGEGLMSWGGMDMLPGDFLPVYPYYAKGKGPSFTGGGAGNGKYSGGGGGGNIALGGRGGLESSSCGSPATGGTGGKGTQLTILDDNSRIFMGGGGGGSTSVTAGTGGNGGGIILIICNELIGNGHSVKADGANGGTASGLSGAGGGGAGGSVVLYLESFGGSNISLSSAGGNGGNTVSGNGEGGGGAGGMIWTSNILPGYVTKSVAPGTRGTNTGVRNSSDGSIGKTYTNFIPVLNGFLFNTIRSSATGNLTDSICSNNIPYPVFGTIPVGGSGNYTYLWQKRKYRLTAYTSIVSSNSLNYTFTATEADSFEIRRIVTDNITSLSDTSKQALVMVQPKIQNNVVNIYSHIISLTDTICFGQDPKLIDQVLPDLFVPTTKSLYYYWQDSTQAATWGTVLGTAKSYDPNPGGGLTTDTWYRRKVVSGRCADSTSRVKFTVLPVIQNNVVSAAQEICHGMTFANLTQAAGYTLTGGNNPNYLYLWQTSTSGVAGSWSTASGTNNTSGYNPPESVTDTEVKSYYRRIIYSGSNNVCVDSSASLLLTEWKKISNNLITSADQTICSGSVPANILAANPADGNHTYSVTWLQKTAGGSFSPATGPNTLYNYQPPALTDSTWYRRYVTSSFCADTSNMVVVNVHKPIQNNTIALPSALKDSTICVNQQIPLINGAHPTGGTNNPVDDTYLWQVSTPGNSSWNTATGTVNGMTYQTGNLSNATINPLMYYYRRSFTSGMCQTYSDTVTVKVLPKITGNTVTADQAVCYNTAPAALTGPGLSGGDPGVLTWKWQQSTDGGTTWSTAMNTSNQQNYSPPTLTVPTNYRRWIYSGLSNCCKDSSNILNISINPLPVSVVAPATDTICEGGTKPFSLNISASTAAPWTVKYRETYLKTGTYTETTLTGISAASSTVNVSPVITSATLDSAAYSYTVSSVADNNGCTATSMTGSRKIIVYNGLDNNSGFSAGTYNGICGPSIQLTGKRNFGTPLWTYDPSITPASPQSADNVTVTVPLAATTPDVTYRFSWTVVNGKCQGKDSVDLTFFQHPGPVSAQPDTPLFSFDGTYTLTSTPPTLGTGEWYSDLDGQAVPGGVLTGLENGITYKYKWLVVNGACRDSVYTSVIVRNYKIPNAFSPNNDTWNDVFEIEGLDTLKTYITFTVFTSTGTKVYSTSNETGSYVPWNGENEKGIPVPDGTYYYVMTLRSKENSKIQKFSGFIIVKRDVRSG